MIVLRALESNLQVCVLEAGEPAHLVAFPLQEASIEEPEFITFATLMMC